jgi:hypothetical protein
LGTLTHLSWHRDVISKSINQNYTFLSTDKQIIIQFYFSNQQVAQVIQVGLEMDNVMMLQTTKGVTLMVEIVVDQTLIHNIARNAYALKI